MGSAPKPDDRQHRALQAYIEAFSDGDIRKRLILQNIAIASQIPFKSHHGLTYIYQSWQT
jgi:hypothetical protein